MVPATPSRHWRTAALLLGAAWVALLAVACGGGGDALEDASATPRRLGLPQASSHARSEPSPAPTAAVGTQVPAQPCGPQAITTAGSTPRAPADWKHDPEHLLGAQVQALTAGDLGLAPAPPIGDPFQD